MKGVIVKMPHLPMQTALMMMDMLEFSPRSDWPLVTKHYDLQGISWDTEIHVLEGKRINGTMADYHMNNALVYFDSVTFWESDAVVLNGARRDTDKETL